MRCSSCGMKECCGAQLELELKQLEEEVRARKIGMNLLGKELDEITKDAVERFEELAKIDVSEQLPDRIWLINWRNNAKIMAGEFLAKYKERE